MYKATSISLTIYVLEIHITKQLYLRNNVVSVHHYVDLLESNLRYESWNILTYFRQTDADDCGSFHYIFLKVETVTASTRDTVWSVEGPEARLPESLQLSMIPQLKMIESTDNWPLQANSYCFVGFYAIDTVHDGDIVHTHTHTNTSTTSLSSPVSSREQFDATTPVMRVIPGAW